MSKPGGLNIKECLQPRKTLRGKIVFAGEGGSRPRPAGRVATGPDSPGEAEAEGGERR